VLIEDFIQELEEEVEDQSLKLVLGQLWV